MLKALQAEAGRARYAASGFLFGLCHVSLMSICSNEGSFNITYFGVEVAACTIASCRVRSKHEMPHACSVVTCGFREPCNWPTPHAGLELALAPSSPVPQFDRTKKTPDRHA
jgi:hypothetical protein